MKNIYLQNLLNNIWYNFNENNKNNKDNTLTPRLDKYWFRLYKYFTKQIKDWLEEVEDKEELSKEIYNFFSFYFKQWDFGYFRKKYDNYTYKLDYEGEDTKFIWSSQDSYFVKTDDNANNFTIDLKNLVNIKLQLRLEKIQDTEKWSNEVEVEKIEDNKYLVKIYNISTSKSSKDKTKTKEYLLEQIKDKLNKILWANLWDKFIKDNQDKLERNFFVKFSEDYFIHKNLKEFLEKELMNYIWEKYWNAKIQDYNTLLIKTEKEKIEELKQLLENIEIDKNDKEIFFDLIDKYLISKWIYEKTKIIEEVKKLKKDDWIKAINLLKENEELNKLFKEYIKTLDLKQVVENDFWDDFRKYSLEFIDILSQIEDAKKLIWLQKKNVLKSDYVVTIDRILKAGWDKNFVLNELLNESNYIIVDWKKQTQIDEWKQLWFVDDNFKKEDIFENEKYKFLPIDTKYLDEEKKFKLLSLFDDLEEKLDGLLIKSENFQALKTIQDKYKEQVKTIYIDPPYNTWNDDFVYKDNYNHSSWLSMMENRLRLARELMREDGWFFTSLWDTKENIRESHRYTFLQDIIFGDKNYINQIAVKVKSSAGVSWWWEDSKLKKNKEWLFFYAKDKELLDFNKPIEWQEIDFNDFDYTKVLLKKWERKLIAWRLKDKTILSWKEIKQKWLEKEVEIKIYEYTWYEIKSIAELVKEKLKQLKKEKSKLSKEEEKIFKEIFKKEVILENLDKFFTSFKAQSSIYEDIVSYFGKEWMVWYEYKPISGKDKWKLIENLIYNWRLVDFAWYRYKIKNWKLYKKEEIWDMWVENWWQWIWPEGWIDFNNAKKPEKFIKRIMDINNTDYILDFFAWSWTTCAVAQKMWKKWIWIEINQYFDTTILARLKRVLFCEQSWISKEVNWQWWWFFKYIYLDQYDEILERLDFKDFETNFNEEKDKKKAKKENFDKKIIYIYNQIINWKKEKDLINTAIYHFNFKEQRYYHNKDYTLVETDKSYILKIKTNNLNSLAENLDDKKTIYTSKEDYEKLSDKLKIKVKVLDYLFNYSV